MEADTAIITYISGDINVAAYSPSSSPTILNYPFGFSVSN